MQDSEYNATIALEHFRRVWQRAQVQDIITRLTGRTNDLLSYDEVRQKLKARVSGMRKLLDIPVDAIVGSVGRYTDFTRTFLPRVQGDRARWSNVMRAMQDQSGTPPIEVYQLGAVYFVLDGNHRVSVAHALGLSHIQAYVTQVETRVPITPNTSPDDLIRQAEYADFLELTDLDVTRPEADLQVTNPGQYRALVADIEAKRHEQVSVEGHDMSLITAATAWYDDVYLPIVQIIRERGLLDGFPGRTETDLYVWISRHRSKLEATLGWTVDAAAAAQDLVESQGRRPGLLNGDLGENVMKAFIPPALDAGPPPGQWRVQRGADTLGERLGADVLVALSGDEHGWNALDQAILIAQHEGGRLNGLHVVHSEVDLESTATQAVEDEFLRRCGAAGVDGQLAIAAGIPAEVISQRARWNDIVVVSVAHPPGSGPIARLRSAFHTLVQHCPRPILTVPQTAVPLRSALLSYDGSPKATEALYVAAYLTLQWRMSLVVVTVRERSRTTDETQVDARHYLEANGITATYVTASGPIADVILETAKDHESDVILIGGYGYRPLFEAVLGSTVDQLLRDSDRPLLICR